MSPRTKKQYEAIREEKRALIMQSALELFSRNGYLATTISNIARYAGISKGLMYNYFPSKEELLHEIIRKSVDEMYQYFDPDHDGYLSGDEFEDFVLRIADLLKRKKAVWRLFFRLLMQEDVQKYFNENENQFRDLSGKITMLTEYFNRKKETKPPGYDSVLDMNMFIITLKGFALTYVFSDDRYDFRFDDVVNRIITLYK
ncbi:MAG: TetR/AcrR family transcriptional regulator [Bacteroidales bacterium]|nr:TetR/AcrR family transcriptional regulator [Bacteroidales bacterium]